MELLHATEVGAIAAARSAGYGDKNRADGEAVKAMRQALNQINFQGRIVIGEGERDQAPMLFIGEKLGTGKGQAIDIAVDPLENTNATASLGYRAISVLAASPSGGLFHAPDMYMEKLIVGPEAAGKVHLDSSPKENLRIIARSLEREIRDLVVLILDRDRNEELIAQVRAAGARVKLVPDGDLLPGVVVCMRGSGIHAVMGIGAAPEGVISAAGIRCLKGELQARFWPKTEAESQRLEKMGGQLKKIYTQDDLASGKNLLFCATGVTSGDELTGVRFFGGGARTHSMLMSTQTEKVRLIDTTHVFNKEEIEYRL